MSKRYKFRNPHALYFSTTTVIHWIDLFTRQEYAQLLVKNLNYCIDNKGLNVHGWVIMPSHFHMIISSSDVHLAKIFQGLKSVTTREVIQKVNSVSESRRRWLLDAFRKQAQKNKRGKEFLLWQDGNHPLELIRTANLQRCLAYIHRNPVKAGFVSEPEHWKYSSAADYSGKQGLLPIVFI